MQLPRQHIHCWGGSCTATPWARAATCHVPTASSTTPITPTSSHAPSSTGSPCLRMPRTGRSSSIASRILREHKSTELNAFVVMSTHLHAVLWPRNGMDVSDVLRDFKRHTSRAISREAAKQGHNDYLQAFAAARSSFRSGRAEYQVWQEGSHPEAIYDDDFARQKIEYIHNNPVKAGLVGRPRIGRIRVRGRISWERRRIRRRISWTCGKTHRGGGDCGRGGWQLRNVGVAVALPPLRVYHAGIIGFRSPARSLSS